MDGRGVRRRDRHSSARRVSRSPGDFEAKLGELERLSGETRNGRFRADNPLQRDLEYWKFSHEYSRVYGVNRRLPYVNDPFAVLYRKFVELPELDHDHDETWRLEGRHLREVKRAAYEAYLFLRFLLRFRAGTSRPIVVVGNNRYGRQWVVEPLEDLLGDGFTLRYDGVPSHTSMRLTVAWARNFEQSADNTGPWTPDAFPMEFVREMDRDMPHIVVADGKSVHGYAGDMMLSRASKIYANWVAAFNDVRAEGRRSAYERESCLPADHLRELVHWFEFVRLRRQLAEWVSPGPTYRVGLWAPQPTETVQMGEIRVPNVPPELDTDRPQFVLANSIIYETDSLPEELQDTVPYYFDGPGEVRAGGDRLRVRSLRLPAGGEGYDDRYLRGRRAEGYQGRGLTPDAAGELGQFQPTMPSAPFSIPALRGRA